ncbi:MAG: hypothetical protein ACK2U9_01110, partial [Anaerolineae bacterium]
LAQARWFRRTSSVGQFSLGAQRYGLGKDFANRTLEITFDAQTQELICLSEDGRQESRLYDFVRLNSFLFLRPGLHRPPTVEAGIDRIAGDAGQWSPAGLANGTASGCLAAAARSVARCAPTD